jgi:hypothetical protein
MRENSDFATKINELNVELSGNSQSDVNEYYESESDGNIDGFGAGCCKCSGGVAVAMWYPQIHGQTERINQMIEAYLCSFINYEMDNWVGLLPIAEFTDNISVTQATGLSPFFTNYGRHLACTNLSTTPISNDTQEGYINHIISVQGLVTRNLKATQERMKKYADLKYKDAPEFKIGDLVMLDRRYIQIR